MDKLDKLLKEATDNVREDRKKAELLLEDVIDYIAQQQDRHREVGLNAAKYLESLQRSNDQLVKITALFKSKMKSTYGDLDKDEKDGLYDELEEPSEEKSEQEESEEQMDEEV